MTDDMTDIVKRLRARGVLDATAWEAADALVTLRDENAALKAELDRIMPVLNYLLDGN